MSLTYIQRILAHQFSQIESDPNAIAAADRDAIAQGMVFLSDAPSQPLFVVKNADHLSIDHLNIDKKVQWQLNRNQSLYPAATLRQLQGRLQQAFPEQQMTAFAASASGGSLAGQHSAAAMQASEHAANSANPAAEVVKKYQKQPMVQPAQADAPPLDYQYQFAIACSLASLQKDNRFQFMLSHTDKEKAKFKFTARAVSGIETHFKTELTTALARNLSLQIGQKPLPLRYDNVRIQPNGSEIALDGFIPLMPVLQQGERLGFPRQGYFYHFLDLQLVQEYKIDSKIAPGSFSPTASTASKLASDQPFNQLQNQLLVFWKKAGKIVDNQYLIYLPQPISAKQLEALDTAFLLAHGIKLDIAAMLQQLQLASQTPLPQKVSEAASAVPTHQVQRDQDGQRETWPKIAQQYKLSAKELLALNPRYDKNPASLAAGDILVVGKSEKSQVKEIAGLPKVSPQAYNIAAQSLYDYPAGMPLADGKLSPCSQAHRLYQDVLLVNLSTQQASQLTAYGAGAILAAPLQVLEEAATGLAVLSHNMSQLGSWSVSEALSAGLPRVAGGLFSLFWPSQLGDGSLDSFLPMASDFSTHPELSDSQLRRLGVRFHFYRDAQGQQQITGIHTGEGRPYGGRVQHRYAERQQQQWRIALDQGLTLTWTPDGSMDQPTAESRFPDHPPIEIEHISILPISEQDQQFGTILYPEESLKEYLVTFPADSGVSPLYLVFKTDPRDQPGVVTGQGEEIKCEVDKGTWLSQAGEGEGVPIPAHIADKLRGRSFTCFDAFRKAFWIEVANDAELSAQFNLGNRKRMKDGLSPITIFKETVGKRRSYELHHIKQIQHGGKVYHIDNIRVNTPLNHINIHKG